MAAGLHGVLLPELRAQDEPSLQTASLERGVYPLSPLFASPVSAAYERTAELIMAMQA